MLAILYALVAAVLSAFNTLLFRKAMKGGAEVWSTQLIFYSGAMLLILLFAPFPDISSIPTTCVWLLAICGLCWIAVGYLDLHAYKYLDASVSEVYGSTSILLLTLSGLLFFGESLSLLKFAGISLVFSSIVYCFRTSAFELNRGVFLKLLSVLFVTVVFTIDKYLVEHVAKETIFFFGYAIPFLAYCFLRPSAFRKVPETLRKTNYLICITPFFSILRFYFILMALTVGELGISYTVLKTGILFVFAAEMLLSRSRENAVEKGVICTACVAGLIVMSQ